MPVLPTELAEVMEKLEASREPIADYDISAAIATVVSRLKQEGHDLGLGLHAEAMAFDFCEAYKHDQTGWGTYYGPQMVVPKGDKYIEWPSIHVITSDTLDYWQARSQEATHPMLRCRYADLAWDFSPRVRGKSADFVCASTMIDAAVDIAEGALAEHSTEAYEKLERALNVALSTSDEARVKRLAESVISYEAATANTEHEGTWGFSYDLLVENKKVPLEEEQIAAIVKALEQRLAEAAEIPKGQQTPRDHFASEHAAVRLARYYRRRDRLDDVKRVLAVYAGAFAVMAKSASAMLGVAWLRKVFDVLTDFGQREQADEVAVLMRDLGKDSAKGMAKFSHKMEIKNDDVDRYLAGMMEGGVDIALARIARTFVPDSKKAESQLKEVASGAVLWGMVSHSIVDAEGREIARVGSVQDDPEGRVVTMMSQNLQLEGIFLRLALERCFEEFGITAENFTDRVLQSPLFLPSRRHLLLRAFTSYFVGDDATAIHLLIPQIEHAFRQLLVLSKRSTYKKGRHGGLNVKMLDDLLRDPAVDQVFGADAVKYFKVLLTDQRGWNLRNNVSHGLIDIPEQSPVLTDRLIHVSLILSMIRRKSEDDSSADAKGDNS